ncbi:hypothetical protein Scep_017155 [Stephania cephalantha]|uniref:Geranylgeranyl diphosphate synthase n=1 Tax=Stephania cephalantha TaxID=152367 RepID=A0AAP0NTA8_9MAGN
MPAARAVEMIHTMSLIHDDLPAWITTTSEEATPPRASLLASDLGEVGIKRLLCLRRRLLEVVMGAIVGGGGGRGGGDGWSPMSSMHATLESTLPALDKGTSVEVCKILAENPKGWRRQQRRRRAAALALRLSIRAADPPLPKLSGGGRAPPLKEKGPSLGGPHVSHAHCRMAASQVVARVMFRWRTLKGGAVGTAGEGQGHNYQLGRRRWGVAIKGEAICEPCSLPNGSEHGRAEEARGHFDP